MFRYKMLAKLLILSISYLFSSCTSLKQGDNSTNNNSVIQETSKTIDEKAIEITQTIPEVEKADFVGKWNRTNIIKAWAAEIEIKDQRENSFQFSFLSKYDGNIGVIDGTAYLETENTASFDYIQEIDKDHPVKNQFKVQFILENDVLAVKVFATDGSELDFGHNEFVDGEYTKSDPVYKNENIVNEILPTEEIKNKMIQLLGDKAYNQMVYVMQYGIYEETITYSGFVSATKQGVDLLIDEDKIYCLMHSAEEGYVFYTNDKKYKDSLPISLKFSHGDDFKAKYVYKAL